MATHSSILAWRILWTEEPNRLQSMGSQRVVPGSTPSGSRSTQGMSGIIKEGHTQKVTWKKRFFIFRIAQFLQNCFSYLPLTITPCYIRCWFHTPVNIFPHIFPSDFIWNNPDYRVFSLNVPYTVFLPQWPNLLTLTKTMLHRFQIQYEFFGQQNNTREGL